jgi:tight adherence protein C
MLSLIIALVGASAIVLLREAKSRDIGAGVVSAVYGESQSAPLAGVTKYLYALGERVRGYYSAQNIEYLRNLIQAAGYNPHRVLPILLGVKVAVMILLPLIAVALASFFAGSIQMRLAIVGIGVIVGVLGPELALSFMRRKFATQLQRGTPDALDLLVVCSEAGMGLESALERVSEEMITSNPAMARVLTNLLDDLRVLPDRREAFTNLGNRTGVDGLRRFGTMLGQSLYYGTPLGQALRAVATELRRDRMNKLEEQAVKLPAMLIFPLIFFIMPSLYIVLLGPSFMRLYDSLKFFTGSVLLHH